METYTDQDLPYSIQKAVSTLPIRNGNCTPAPYNSPKIYISSRLLFCKYLTYKEWKPLWVLLSCLIVIGYFCKYLTYKEWKQYPAPPIIAASAFVSTLPIRNGNNIIT